MEEKKERKKIVPILLFILMLILIIVGGTYAVFFYGKSGETRNVISTRAISCAFNEGPLISIKSAFPISDEVGKKLSAGAIDGYDQGYYDATLSCECKGTKEENCRGAYEIYALNTSTGAQIDERYIKVYITDGEGTERALSGVTTFKSLADSSANPNGKLIYRQSFTKSFSQRVRLRFWISKDYPVSEESLTFKAKLGVKVSE